MEQNKPYYNYAEFIFDFFARSGCRAGQGGYVLRGIDDRARNAGYNQEQIILQVCKDKEFSNIMKSNESWNKLLNYINKIR